MSTVEQVIERTINAHQLHSRNRRAVEGEPLLYTAEAYCSCDEWTNPRQSATAHYVEVITAALREADLLREYVEEET